jgi:hypothetical protein
MRYPHVKIELELGSSPCLQAAVSLSLCRVMGVFTHIRIEAVVSLFCTDFYAVLSCVVLKARGLVSHFC